MPYICIEQNMHCNENTISISSPFRSLHPFSIIQLKYYFLFTHFAAVALSEKKLFSKSYYTPQSLSFDLENVEQGKNPLFSLGQKLEIVLKERKWKMGAIGDFRRGCDCEMSLSSDDELLQSSMGLQSPSCSLWILLITMTKELVCITLQSLNTSQKVSLLHKKKVSKWVLFCTFVPQTRFLDLIIEPSRATLQLSKNQQSMINEILDFYDYYVSYKHVKSENRFL